MRRQAPTMPISPKQLKHFAAATVAITALLALFAGGEDAGLAAQIEARDARNQLIETETSKLGTKQLKSTLKVRGDRHSKFAFADGGEVVDTAGEWGGNNGGGQTSRGAPPAKSQRPSFLPPPELQAKPGSKITKQKVAKKPRRPGDPEDSQGGANDGDAGNQPQGGRPENANMDAALEASRQRSGSADRGGD